MSSDTHVTVCIIDEGYYRKFFALSTTTTFKKLKEAYRGQLCQTCSRPELLDFWFDTAQVKDTDTPHSLGMTTGDIIDVRISEQVTRGACPLPPSQTLPNIHYLAEQAPTLNRPGSATVSASANPLRLRDRAAYNNEPDTLFIPAFNHDRGNPNAVRETQAVPTPSTSDRVTLTVRDQAGVSLTLRIKKSTPFRKVLDAYAKHARREVGTCRMFIDGTRLALEQTPGELECEENEIVDVHWEQVGGSADDSS